MWGGEGFGRPETGGGRKNQTRKSLEGQRTIRSCVNGKIHFQERKSEDAPGAAAGCALVRKGKEKDSYEARKR